MTTLMIDGEPRGTSSGFVEGYEGRNAQAPEPSREQGYVEFVFRAQIPEALSLAPKSIAIGGIRFLLREESGGYLLNHPSWSLEGAGPTLAMAEQDLLQEARSLAIALLGSPRTSMTDDAGELLEFCVACLHH